MLRQVFRPPLLYSSSVLAFLANNSDIIARIYTAKARISRLSERSISAKARAIYQRDFSPSKFAILRSDRRTTEKTDR